jgi:thioredoxin reductase (NADPH)
MSAHCLAHEPTLIKEKVLNIYPGDIFTLLTPAATYEAKAVIIATGVVATVLFAGERDFLGRGVSYCATCDGMFYKDKNVAVVAYTEEGETEAKFLGELCRQVYYLPQYKAEPPAFRDNVRVVTAKPRPSKATARSNSSSPTREASTSTASSSSASPTRSKTSSPASNSTGT